MCATRYDTRLPAIAAAIAAGGISIFSGCESRPQLRIPAAAIGAPPLTSIAGGTVQAGFTRGVLRQDRLVTGFRVTTHPITLGSYEACVKSGTCEPMRPDACGGSAGAPVTGQPAVPSAEAAPGTPALCVDHDQAAKYCRAIGGRLPTIDEWFMAARGPSPRRFSWGTDVTRCDQHPRARELLMRRESQLGQAAAASACPDPADAGLELVVGQHAAGKSPTGVEDVLLAPGELVEAAEGSDFRACSRAGSACVMYGIEAGAIDSVEMLSDAPAEDAGQRPAVPHAYAFRCVVGSEQESGK